MLKFESILCSAPARPLLAIAAVLVLGACGQRGPLYLPTEPGAIGRATLPQTLDPMRTVPTSPQTPEGAGTAPGSGSSPTARPAAQ